MILRTASWRGISITGTITIYGISTSKSLSIHILSEHLFKDTFIMNVLSIHMATGTPFSDKELYGSTSHGKSQQRKPACKKMIEFARTWFFGYFCIKAKVSPSATPSYNLDPPSKLTGNPLD